MIRKILVIALLMPLLALADTIGLQWDHSGVGVTSFTGHCGDAPGIYAPIPAWTVAPAERKFTLTIPGNVSGVTTKYCAVRANGIGGPSGYSNELKLTVATVPPATPDNFRTFDIQATINMDTGEVVAIAIKKAVQ